MKLWDRSGAMNFSESLALKAVSLLLALILWITILGFKQEEVRKYVKFEPLVAPGMMITNKIPPHILFTLRGPRILLKDVEKKILPIRPDLRRNKEKIIPISISEERLGELPLDIKVISIQPTNILIRLEEIVERYIPVKPTLRGLPAEGYDISRVRVSPPKVAVSGPQSLLEGLEFVGTEVIDTQDLTGAKEVIVDVEVDPVQGFRLSREKIARVKVYTTRSKVGGTKK